MTDYTMEFCLNELAEIREAFGDSHIMQVDYDALCQRLDVMYSNCPFELSVVVFEAIEDAKIRREYFDADW